MIDALTARFVEIDNRAEGSGTAQGGYQGYGQESL